MVVNCWAPKYEGGENLGLAACRLARVAPWEKPLRNRELEFWAVVKTELGASGEIAPTTLKIFTSGGFRAKLAITDCGKESAKFPMPPRTTVFASAKGVHAKPKRGSTAR